MRPDLVELEAPGVEAALLGSAIGGGRDGGLGLEVLVHALVAGVLLRGAGLDEVGQDAKLDEPDGELREAAQGHGSEGCAVVGAKSLGQAVFLEQALQDETGVTMRGTEKSLAGEEGAAEAVLDGEGVAVDAVEGLELTLEVRGPDGVGSIEGSGGSTGVRSRGSALLLLDEAGADEVAMQDAFAWEPPLRMQRAEALQDLLGAPARLVPAQVEGGLEYVLGRGMRAVVRSVGAVLEPIDSLELVSLEPLVALLAADAEPTTGLGKREEAPLDLEDELLAFLHGIGLRPWHGRLQEMWKTARTLGVETVTHQGSAMCYQSAVSVPTRLPN